MNLTRLELSGFKSFADTIDLTFESGMTAIVGPNGCGKSNVSDAVRWVLGEQRARMLRGSRMEEVIFQGSVKRKPLNVAEVSLYFDNSDGTLPIAYQEVVVTRRLSRGGQSDYLVNQAPARLKDVQDLLRGTGLGSDAGVVIEARMIDRLLSDRTEERRSLFEEAAGIGLYRDRKTVTERRLEKTLEDLQRLDDVISEVHTQVRSLARQRGKAERHRTFTTDRFAIVMELARRRLRGFEEAEQAHTERRQQLETDLPRAREALATTERERETFVQERATAEAQRAEVQRLLAERRVELEKLEGDIRLANERLQNSETRKERARAEIERSEATSKQARLELEAAAEELRAASSARASVQTELGLRAASEGEAREKLNAQRDGVRQLETALQQLAESSRERSGEASVVERELADLGTQRTEADQRVAAARTADTTAEARVRECQEKLEICVEQDRQAQGDVEQSRHALSAAKEREAALLSQRRTTEESHAQLQARSEALRTLESERAGLAPAAQQLLDTKERFEPGTIVGPLSDFVRADTDRARATERVLGDWLHAVVIRDERSVHAIQQWHRETEPGPLLLLPLSPGPRNVSSDFTPPFGVRIEPPAISWGNALLADHEASDEAASMVKRSNGAIYLPSTEETSGPLARRAEIDSLAARIAATSAQLERLSTALEHATAEFQSAGQSLESAVQRAEQTSNNARIQRGALDDAMREHQRTQRDLREAEETKRRLDERFEERTQRQQELTSELESARVQRSELEERLSAERHSLATVEAEQEAAREKRVHWQVEEAQVSAREASAKEREERASAMLRETSATIERLSREIQEIDESTHALVTQRSGWNDLLAEKKTEAARLEQASAEAQTRLTRAQNALSECETKLEQCRSAVHQIGEDTHKLELEISETAGERRALTERIEAEWHQPLQQLLEGAEPVDGDNAELAEEAERLAHAIETIGPVNPLAAQEYEEEKNRLDFLQTQREDLSEARSSLHDTLKEIDQTARRLFQETFEEIRQNFQRVFLTLFEGGECDVRLTDPTDSLASEIEIRAAPRGKRTQRIHLLSSGERALVAISLLFAIYLAKPSPFCLLDEVDAPLDDANVQRFIRLLSEFKDDTQFIVITHNPRTMQVSDSVYGVTMQEPGVSTIVGVRLGERQTA